MPSVKTQASFASLLRHYRVEAGLTQETLAERSGLGVRSIQHLERGECQPQRVTLRRLADALLLANEQRQDFEKAAHSVPRQRPAKAARPPEHQNHTAPHNLPIQLTRFIGRQRYISAVQYLLSETPNGPRLLTLTGPGGSGKTRLALEVAATLLDSFEDGVWLVELASLTDPGLVPQAVATTLGLQEPPDRSLTDSLLQFLRQKRVLLVLDNCEHLITSCASLVERLLKGCPSLRILATSQAILGIVGEQAWRIPSLEIPDPNHPWQREDGILKLLTYEAVQLFIERDGGPTLLRGQQAQCGPPGRNMLSVGWHSSGDRTGRSVHEGAEPGRHSCPLE